MAATSKSLLTIFTGQRMQIRMAGKSYGVQRPSLVDGADWTPNLSNQTIMEFDNLNPALNYSVFDDVSFKAAYPQNNQMVVESVLMDADPTVDGLFVDPAGMVPFTCWANMRGLDGNIKGAWLVRDITPSGNPFTGTVKEGAKRTLEGKGLAAILLHGWAIAYTRLRGATVLVAAPAEPTLGQTGSGGSLGADTYYVCYTAVTAVGETTAGAEASIQVISGAVNELTVTMPAISGNILSWNVYVSNRSGATRFVGNTATTTLTITSLPNINAAKPPVNNTSGVPVAAGDVVMTLSGSLYSGLLTKPAIVMPQNGLSYLMVKQNGVTLASWNQSASQDTFSISADGTTFSVLDSSGASDWYDVWTVYKPSPV